MENLALAVKEISESLEREVGTIVDYGPEMIEGHDEELLLCARKANQGNGIFKCDGYTFLPVYDDEEAQVTLYVQGTDTSASDILVLVARVLEVHYKDWDISQERDAFLKNVLLENELPGDVPLKARECFMEYFLPRQVFLLRFGEPCDNNCIKTIRSNLGPAKDYILPIDEHNIVILLDIEGRTTEIVEGVASRLTTVFSGEGRRLFIGIGLPAENLKDTANSYRQADLALTVGNIFKEEETIMWYNKLGLGRLIYQLPPTLCRMFLSEVFAPDTYEALDPETLLTIEKFFENNLNGSETSRQLFVHRNTLVYRLDKVQKITGLDLRTFEDAVLFKLATMVRQYLEAIQQKDEAQTLAKHW